MSVKSFAELPFEILFKMAEEKYQSLDYEQAEYFYSEAYKKNPHDEMLVLCYANLLKVSQKQVEAKEILEKSIRDLPKGSYKRYLELAQIYQGKGIEIAKQGLANPFKSIAPQTEIKRDIAQAYASIAEVCMTDLLQQPQAQIKCKQAMQKGIQFDNTCIDVHLQMANYMMFKDDFQRAKLELVQIHKWIMQERQQYETQTINTAGKYLIEVEQYQKSLDLFQKNHENASSELETLYMLAYCSFKLDNIVRCEEYIEQYQQKYDQKIQNGELVDQEIQEALNEMKLELAKKKKEHEETGEGQEDEWMDVQDEDEI